jgi:CheY-like chemotaxis protein
LDTRIIIHKPDSHQARGFSADTQNQGQSFGRILVFEVPENGAILDSRSIRRCMAKKVLIIDDEADFGVLMKSFFVQRHFEVYVAHTIAEGMRILDEEKPDIIFLDNQLPDGLGWGKAEFILLHHPQVTLNLISALDVPVTSASGFRILHKPDLRDELVRMFN